MIALEPSRKPLNLLVKKLNGEVSIRLKNDVEYRGRMIDADSHMNIILEGATEYRGNSPTANYGNVILQRQQYSVYLRGKQAMVNLDIVVTCSDAMVGE